MEQVRCDGTVCDVVPKTFYQEGLCIIGYSWTVYHAKYPDKSFEDFWCFCCSYYPSRSYALCHLLDSSGGDRVSRSQAAVDAHY